MEQPDINEAVKKLEQVYSQEKILDILCCIIKQQMLYGGTLADKINFQLELAKNPHK